MRLRVLGALLALVGVLVGGWFAVNYIDQAGYDRGHAAAEKACQQADIDRLVSTLETSAEQTKQAQRENLRLSGLINQQLASDATTTEELRNALNQTAAERAACRFNADIMQQLKQARDRAARAAASGITDAMPGAGGSREQ